MIAQKTNFVDELRRDVCRCGAAKRAGRPFCFDCFRILPADVQQGLYRRIGRGYEAARVRAERFFPSEDGDGVDTQERPEGPRCERLHSRGYVNALFTSREKHMAIVKIQNNQPVGFMIGTDTHDLRRQCQAHMDAGIRNLATALYCMEFPSSGRHDLGNGYWLLVV